MFKQFNPISVIAYHLSLLQLEEYNLLRFLSAIRKTAGFPRPDKRNSIKLTLKISFISLISFLLLIFTGWVLINLLLKTQLKENYLIIGWVLISIFLSYFYYLFLSFITLIILPIDKLIKSIIIFLAKQKINKLKGLRVVGVVGSYGKTTMKEVIAKLLSQKPKVLVTPRNVNTDIGISLFILKKLKKDIQILVVEMGEHYPGDITKICSIVNPEIGVICGLNETHLDRMKTFDNLVKTIFEISKKMGQKNCLVLNADDKNIRDVYKNFTKGIPTYFFSSKNNDLCNFKIKNDYFDEKNLTNNFTLKKDSFEEKVTTKILGHYIIGNFIAGLLVADFLGYKNLQINKIASELLPINHRLEPIVNQQTNILVIDDSYNGNPDGIKESLDLLTKFKNRRKVFITPGLVELGNKTAEIHKQIGADLSKTANLVILIKTSVTPFIKEGLENSGFTTNNLLLFNSANEAYNNLSKVLKNGDVVIFQNDWPDNYF